MSHTYIRRDAWHKQLEKEKVKQIQLIFPNLFDSTTVQTNKAQNNTLVKIGISESTSEQRTANCRRLAEIESGLRTGGTFL